MSVRKLMTAIAGVFALGGMGYGTFAVLAEGSPGETVTKMGPVVEHDVIEVGRDAAVEPIESPRECRHEAGIRDACTHL
jgi:hypothetical protein